MQKKEASVGLFLGSLAAGELAMRGLQRVGKGASNDLLNIGIEQGKNGLQMNPLLATQFKNYLGKQQYEPYIAGQAIGSRIQKMDEPTQERFLAKLQGLAKARNQRLDGEHAVEQAKWRAAPFTDEPKRSRIPLIDVVDKMDATNKGKMHNLLSTKPIPAEQKAPLQSFTGNLLSAPAAYFDHRIVARPVLRGLEGSKGYDKVLNKIDANETTSKAYDVIRKWYD